jgi:hypothetical protein
MGKQHSPPTVCHGRRSRLSLFTLMVLTLSATQGRHPTVASAQLLLPLSAQDIRTRQPHLGVHRDGFHLQDPSPASYQDIMSSHANTKGQQGDDDDDDERLRRQLEEMCISLLSTSPDDDNGLNSQVAEPRLVGASDAPEDSTWRLW